MLQTRVRSRCTGKERDGESGLDYFGARYYSSNLGRFITPDWAAAPTAVPYADFGNPQSLNLFTYVGNNPLGATDADGHCCMEDLLKLINQTAEKAKQKAQELKQSVDEAIKTFVEDEDFRNDVMDRVDVVGQSFFAYGALEAGMEGLSGEGTSGRAASSEGAVARKGSAGVRARLPQDVAVDPEAPAPLSLNRPIGTSPTQNAAAQADIQAAQARGATDFRVNQRQVNAAGRCVGVCRPDVQHTEANGQRVYTEYERSASNRGPVHQQRLQANDPNGKVVLKKVD